MCTEGFDAGSEPHECHLRPPHLASCSSVRECVAISWMVASALTILINDDHNNDDNDDVKELSADLACAWEYHATVLCRIGGDHWTVCISMVGSCDRESDQIASDVCRLARF
jgi:hypothetical protein